MQISYRQGLISAQSNFLQIGQNDTRYVDLILSQTPVIAAIADGSKDYLIGEYKSIPNAWGPFTDSQTHYLYWEINPVGKLIRGSTTLSPESGDVAPPAVVGQMWWDTTVNVFKVYDGQRWVKTLRVFAGTLQSGGILVAEPFISQEGLDTPANAGFILTDGFGGAFRDNAGGFLTTDTQLSSNNTGSLVKLDGVQVLAQANENIPKFTLVYLVDGRAAIASGDPVYSTTKAPIGIVMFDAYQNDAVEVITSGKTVFNQQWDWPLSSWGKPVYCSPLGTITPNKPGASKNVRVGTILNAQSILLNFDWETDALTSSSSSGMVGIAATYPLQLSGATNYPTITLPPASATTDGFITMADWSRIPALEHALSTKANLSHTHAIADVVGLQIVLDTKAQINLTHAISDVIDLQTSLDGKSNVGHTHVIADITDLTPALSDINTALNLKMTKVTGITGNFPRILASGLLEDSTFSPLSFALATHTHIISNVAGLQNALDVKAALYHEHAISDVTGLQLILDGKAALVHTHTIAEVVGLQDALDGKANSVHTHVIADVAGLQLILDNKSPLVHAHAIADVTGLQLILDGKAAVVHTHAIADVVGLQTALDNKSNVGHRHMTSDITDFASAVKSLIFSDIVSGDHNIIVAPDSDNVKLTISADFYGALVADLIAGPNVILTPDAVNKTVQIDVNIPPASLSWPLVSPEGAMIESNHMTYNGNPGVGALTLRGMANTSVVLAVGGNYVNDPGPSASLALTYAGEVKINGDTGVMGQVLTSNGPLMAVQWANLPTPTVAAMQDQVVFGTGEGITSSQNFKYVASTGALSVNPLMTSSALAGNINIGASYDGNWLNGPTAATGTLALKVNNHNAIFIDNWSNFYFNQRQAGSQYNPSTYLYSPDGTSNNQQGASFTLTAGNADSNTIIQNGGGVNLYAGANANWMSEGASIEVGAGGIPGGGPDQGGDIHMYSGWAGWYNISGLSGIADTSRKSGSIFISSSDVWTGPIADTIQWKIGDVVISTGQASGANTATPGKIIFAPQNNQKIAIGEEGQLQISNDGGTTWNSGATGQVLVSTGSNTAIAWSNVVLPTTKQVFTTSTRGGIDVQLTIASISFITTTVPFISWSNGTGRFTLADNGVYSIKVSGKMFFVNGTTGATIDWPTSTIGYGIAFGSDTFTMTLDQSSHIRNNDGTVITGTIPGQYETWTDEFIIHGQGDFVMYGYTNIGNQTTLAESIVQMDLIVTVEKIQ